MKNNKVLTLFAIIVFISAVLIQYTQNEIPSWLVGALGMVLTYLFGLHTERTNGNSE